MKDSLIEFVEFARDWNLPLPEGVAAEYEQVIAERSKSRMDAREYLEEIEYLDGVIRGKLDEVYQLRCLATSCTAPTDREPGGASGVSDRVGKIVAKIVDLQDETNDMLDAFIDERQARIKVIEAVKKPLYYTILHKHYIGVKRVGNEPTWYGDVEDEPTWYMSLAEIAESEGYSYSHICDCHRRALAEVQLILDGR